MIRATLAKLTADGYATDTIRYEVRFLASRQTLAIEVHPDSRVLVRAPVGCPEALIAERVQKRAGWISRQLAEFERYRPRTPARQYVNGESHLYLGRQYRLKLVSGDAASVKLTRGQLLVTLPGEPEPERVKALLHRWYLDRARAVFTEVLDASLLHFKGVEPPRLIVRAMQSRWGSLSARRHHDFERQPGARPPSLHRVRGDPRALPHPVPRPRCAVFQAARAGDARLGTTQAAAGSGAAVTRKGEDEWQN